MSDFALYTYACLMGLKHYFFGQCNISFQIVHRPINHNRLKAGPYRIHNGIIRKIVVRMQPNRHLHLARQFLYHGRIISKSCCVLDRNMLRVQHNHCRCVRCLCSIYDRSCHRIIHTDE